MPGLGKRKTYFLMPSQCGLNNVFGVTASQSHEPDRKVEARSPRLKWDNLDKLCREEVAVDHVPQTERLFGGIVD